MKKAILLAALLVCACAQKTDEISLSAHNGTNGTNGTNGHSLVSQYNEATALECGDQGGTRLDIYIDMDDSLSATNGDVYLNSFVVCNGLPGLVGAPGIQGIAGTQGPQGEVGPQGPPGEQGVAGTDGTNGTSGTQGPQGLPGTPGAPGAQGPQGPQGLPGASVSIVEYTSSNCTHIAGTTSYVKAGEENSNLYSGSTCASNTKFAEVSQGESYWVSSNALAVYSNDGVRVITY